MTNRAAHHIQKRFNALVQVHHLTFGLPLFPQAELFVIRSFPQQTTLFRLNLRESGLIGLRCFLKDAKRLRDILSRDRPLLLPLNTDDFEDLIVRLFKHDERTGRLAGKKIQSHETYSS